MNINFFNKIFYKNYLLFFLLRLGSLFQIFSVLFITFSINAKEKYYYDPYYDKFKYFFSLGALASYDSKNSYGGGGWEISFRILPSFHSGFFNYFLDSGNSSTLWNYDSFQKRYLYTSYSKESDLYVSGIQIRYFPIEFPFFIGSSLRITNSYKENILVYTFQDLRKFSEILSKDEFFKNSIEFSKNFGNWIGITFDIGLFGAIYQKWWNTVEFGILQKLVVSFQIYESTKKSFQVRESFFWLIYPNLTDSIFMKDLSFFYRIGYYYRKTKPQFFSKSNTEISYGFGLAFK